MRITRRWNQTGQKWAGEPDIARAYFTNHKTTLWILIVATYLWNMQCLASHGLPRFVAAYLATASALFKLAFTSEDSPELMSGWAKMLSSLNDQLGIPLSVQPRIVFLGLVVALVYAVASGPRRVEGIFNRSRL